MIEITTAATDRVTWRVRHWIMLPWVVLAIGIPASLMLSMIVRDTVDNVAQLRFDRQAGDAKNIIEYRVQFYVDILHGLKALIASQGPNRLQFHNYVKSLDLPRRYPGFDVVNFMTYVPAKDKQRFEESVRGDTSLEPGGYPNFAIKPPGERPEYFVLAYIEPMAGNEFAFGLDVGVNPNVSDPRPLLTLLHSARDSGNLSASGVPLRIKTRGKEYAGLAFRLPVYLVGMPVSTVEQRRAAFLGSVGAGFDVDNLMKNVLDEETAKHMRFRLYDAGPAIKPSAPSSAGTERLLFDSNQPAAAFSSPSVADDPDSVFIRILPMEVGGRIWEVRFSASKDAIIGRFDAILPWAVAAGGMLLTLLLFGMIYSLASSRSRAVVIANEITKDLRESEGSLAEAQQIAHIGNWSLDPASWSMTWSAETYRIFGLDPQSMPMRYADFLQRVHEDDRAAFDGAFRHAVEAGRDCEMEHRVPVHDGSSIRWAHTIVKAARHDRQALVPGTIMCVTERKLAEQQVIESQTLLNEAQKLSHLGCWQWDISGGQVVWSDELYRIYGIDARRFRPSLENHFEMVHPEDKAAVERIIGTAAQTGEGFTLEERILRPDGGVRHLLGHGEVVKDSAGRPVKMLGACLDITEHKHAAEALQASAEQLQALSRRLVEIQELERRQFSRELHDRVGQNLTALSINLDILRTEIPGDANAGLRARLDDSAALLESTTGAIENVMSDLRPPMLDDYGLLPALQWYATEFAGRTGIAVKVHGDERMERLASPVEIALFRIMQEALNNVAKHAHANSADIRLERFDTQSIMSVADDGVGFDGASIANSRRRAGLGMVTMRERTQAIGGQFEVEAVPDGGTRVVVRIPW